MKLLPLALAGLLFASGSVYAAQTSNVTVDSTSPSPYTDTSISVILSPGTYNLVASLFGNLTSGSALGTAEILDGSNNVLAYVTAGLNGSAAFSSTSSTKGTTIAAGTYTLKFFMVGNSVGGSVSGNGALSAVTPVPGPVAGAGFGGVALLAAAYLMRRRIGARASVA